MADFEQFFRKLSAANAAVQKKNVNQKLRSDETRITKISEIFDSLVGDIISIQSSSDLEQFYKEISKFVDTISDVYTMRKKDLEKMTDEDKENLPGYNEQNKIAVRLDNKFYDLHLKLKQYEDEVTADIYSEFENMVDDCQYILYGKQLDDLELAF